MVQTVVDDEEETFITQYSNDEEGEREERKEDSEESDIESTQVLGHSLKDRSVITSPGEPKKPNKVSDLQVLRNKRKADDKTKTGIRKGENLVRAIISMTCKYYLFVISERP